jgi:hypothetical protein
MDECLLEKGAIRRQVSRLFMVLGMVSMDEYNSKPQQASLFTSNLNCKARQLLMKEGVVCKCQLGRWVS